MDLLSDIVEKDPYNDNNTDTNDSLQIKYSKTGFPELYKPEKISSWKQRLREKKQQQQQNKKRKNNEDKNEGIRSKVTNEADSIHIENLKYMEAMTEEQILREKSELLSTLDPKLVKSLLRLIDARGAKTSKQSSSSGNTTVSPLENATVSKSELFKDFEVEGAPGTWVGGYNERSNGFVDALPKLDNEQISKYLKGDDVSKRSVHFLDSEESSVRQEQEEEQQQEQEEEAYENDIDDDDIAPLDYQMAEAIDHMSNEELLRDVHFVKPNESEYEPLDVNDPDFNEKLHERYFPDLPRDIEKLKWMQPVDDDAAKGDIIIEDVSQCRFDFNGNLVPPNRKIESTTHSGLHHHADDPQLAGYTLVELDHLARSTFPAQRCIAIQTLGRVLYKLGKQSYSNQLVPEVDTETFEKENDSDPERVMERIYAMFWDLIVDLKVIEMLELSTNEKFTKSLSVRSYATDALWLWRQGGGDFRKKKGKTGE